jgi:hypothetical protein
MGNRSRGLLVLGLTCLAVSACSGTDASGLTAVVHGTAGGAAGAAGGQQGGAGGTSGGGGSAAASGSAGVAGAGGLVTNGGSAGGAGVAGAGGSAGSSAAGGAAGGGGKGGAAGSGGAGGSGGNAGSGGAGGTAGAGGSGGTGGTGGAGGTGGEIDAGSGGTGGADAAPDAPPKAVAYGRSANKTTCEMGANAFEHQLDWGKGNGRIVVLGALLRGNAQQFSSILYAGTPMHELGSRTVGGMTPWTVWLFYLLDSELPDSAGTNTVTAGFAGQITSCQIDVSSFAHAAQAAPPFTSRQAAVDGLFTAGIANPTAGSMGYDFISSTFAGAQGSLTAGAGQTIAFTWDGFTYHSRASYKACGDANPCNMSWNPQNITAYAWMMALLQAQ